MSARTLAVPLSAPAPAVQFQLDPNVKLRVESVFVEIDNTGGGDIRPLLTVSDQNTQEVAAKRQGDTIPAGGTGSATWALRLTDETPAAVGSSLAWCTAQVVGALPAGVSSQPYVFLDTNDPGAFAIDGAGRLVFNKVGTFLYVVGFEAHTDIFTGPVANPWTTFLQGGSGSNVGINRVRMGSFNASGIHISATFQVWNCTYAVKVTIDAAHLGNTLNWNWSNGTPIGLNATAGITVQELAP